WHDHHVGITKGLRGKELRGRLWGASRRSLDEVRGSRVDAPAALQSVAKHGNQHPHTALVKRLDERQRAWFMWARGVDGHALRGLDGGKLKDLVSQGYRVFREPSLRSLLALPADAGAQFHLGFF